ncbi:MAG: PRC-barrel domain-containing protein [Clostridia bacterium]|nr:PRC-barrel domain-containing protein [Clostridia bacterium]
MKNAFCSIKGRNVYNVENEKLVGRLSDILLYPSSEKLFGIICTNENILYKHRLFRAGKILSVTESRINVIGHGERFVRVLPCEEKARSCSTLTHGFKVVSRAGKTLGYVKDITLDFEIGQLSELEVGVSLAEDLLYGRKSVNAEGVISFCDNRLIINEESLKNKKLSGIQNLLKRR